MWIAYLHADPGGGMHPEHAAEAVLEARDRVRALERQLKATQDNMTSIMEAVKAVRQKSSQGTFDVLEARLRKLEAENDDLSAKMLATSSAIATQNEKNKKAESSMKSAEAAKIGSQNSAPL